MKFHSTDIAGVSRIAIEMHGDERGFFARTWCAAEFAAHGLSDVLTQTSIAVTHRRGTLRGMHYQRPPHAEDKLVRCTRGAAFVVAIDLRADSPTHKRWIGFELTQDNCDAIYVPQGCAQGYQTLTDNTELLYCMSTPYVPDAGSGVRFDDPAFAIEWPLDVTVISPRDRAWPNYAN